MTYLLAHSDTELLHRAVELLEGDLAAVGNVEVLEHLGHELDLVHVRRVPLHDLLLELRLESTRVRNLSHLLSE